MSTMLKLGPADHDRPMSLDEFMAARYENGHRYELVDGKLYVRTWPTPAEALVEGWLMWKLDRYSASRPDILNKVWNKARVYVPGRPGATNVEPDVTAYRDFPHERAFRDLRWQDVSPVLVAEVLFDDDPDKDLVRNVELYFQVPSIVEYWLVDLREEPERPHLRVHHRRGQAWAIQDFRPDDLWTSEMLPGFELWPDPRR